MLINPVYAFFLDNVIHAPDSLMNIKTIVSACILKPSQIIDTNTATDRCEHRNIHSAGGAFAFQKREVAQKGDDGSSDR